MKRLLSLFLVLFFSFLSYSQQCSFTLGPGYTVITSTASASSYSGVTKFYLCAGASFQDDVGVDTVVMLANTSFTAQFANVKVLMRGNAVCYQNGGGNFFWRELTTTIYNPPQGDVFCANLVISNGPSCVVNAVDEINVQDRTGVYPVPASDMICFSLPGDHGVTSIGIYDVSGAVVREVKVEPADTKISVDVKDLPAGVYLYKVLNGARLVAKDTFVK